MPNKKHLKTDAPANGAAAQLLDETPQPQAPAHAITVGGNPHRDRPAPPPPRDSLASITARLAARYWTTNKRFEWALAPNRHHYEFTRYYFEQRVLVDVWAAANNSARKESEKKRACVEAENVRRVAAGEAPIGLIAVVRGSSIPEECFAGALRGESFALIEPSFAGVPT